MPAFKPNQSPPSNNPPREEKQPLPNTPIGKAVIASAPSVKAFRPGESTKSRIHTRLSKELLAYLCQSHLFIYGKIGFYDIVLASLTRALAPIPIIPCVLHRRSDLESLSSLALPKNRPLVMLPMIGAAKVINDTLAECLNNDFNVWLVAYPSTIEKHLLANFRNLFITCGSSSELQLLSDVIPLSAREMQQLGEVEGHTGMFISDFEPCNGGQMRELATRFEIEELKKIGLETGI